MSCAAAERSASARHLSASRPAIWACYSRSYEKSEQKVIRRPARPGAEALLGAL